MVCRGLASSLEETREEYCISEFFLLLVALEVWGPEFQNRSVLLHVDNMTVVELVKRQKARDLRVLRLSRSFMQKCLQLNVIFQAQHVPGANNDIADALSRLQWQRFRRLAPGADQYKTKLPDTIWAWGE